MRASETALSFLIDAIVVLGTLEAPHQSRVTFE
jgi:hypothetical protein